TRHRILRGFVTLEDTVSAVKEGKNLSDILRTDVATVAPDATIPDILSLIVQSNHPLPVVDENGRMHGLVSRASILAALARKGGEA
ncbi:MAG: CBS domain-containing protein, partial [Methanocorpusculum parvum]|nr:CBS domain-containing protein [Methanocorpusculum parvum]